MTPDTDPRRTVQRGYDLIGGDYARRASRGASGVRERYTRLVLRSLPERAALLDLGCGAALPTTRRLAERFQVTGVDISGVQVDLARRNVPEAASLRAYIASVEFPAQSFDAVTAFYSITHLPRELHGPLLQRAAGWLEPGGLLVATMGLEEANGVEEDWLGERMFFSHYGSETNRQLVQDAGLQIQSAEEEQEQGEPATFLWVVARRPG